MRALLQRTVGDYKSPMRVRGRNLLQSRNNKTVACHELRKQCKDAQRELARHRKTIEQQQEEIRRLRVEVIRLECRQEPAKCGLPEETPIGTHGYGATMVCLAVELAKVVGLRPTERVLQIVFQRLGVDQKIPNFTTVRSWLLRLGVSAIDEPVEPAEDWVWLADHSNQIGPEKALVVLGVRASELPPPGTPLTHGDVHTLMVKPAENWSKEDVADALRELIERHGAPRAMLSDNGAELVGGLQLLQNKGKKTIQLQDFKHKAANFFKAMLAKDSRFREFAVKVGQTRSAIQQTELAHLVPPTVKQKARFMNMAATLHWASVMLWLLDHPEAKSREFVTAERLEKKLGWLRGFAKELSEWCQCQWVIDVGLKLIAEEGLYAGVSARFDELVSKKLLFASSRDLASKLIEFVSTSESLLRPGERLPMSTEVLESAFALYKQLERQHSKGGFTSLIASFGALLSQHTPSSVRRHFRNTSTQAARDWIAENLGTTLASKRRQTYAEHKTSATKTTATT